MQRRCCGRPVASTTRLCLRSAVAAAAASSASSPVRRRLRFSTRQHNQCCWPACNGVSAGGRSGSWLASMVRVVLAALSVADDLEARRGSAVQVVAASGGKTIIATANGQSASPSGTRGTRSPHCTIARDLPTSSSSVRAACTAFRPSAASANASPTGPTAQRSSLICKHPDSPLTGMGQCSGTTPELRRVPL